MREESGMNAKAKNSAEGKREMLEWTNLPVLSMPPIGAVFRFSPSIFFQKFNLFESKTFEFRNLT